MPYQQTAPDINPNNFPYQRKWTKAETEELGDRIEKIRAAMVDMVGLSGVTMFIDAGSIANIASHLALAGADMHTDERQYIWRDASTDDDELFELVQWHIKKDVPVPPEPAEDEIDVAVADAREQFEQNLPGEVKRRLIATLIKEYEHDTTDDEDGAR